MLSVIMLKNLSGFVWKQVRNIEVLVYPNGVKYVIPSAESLAESNVFFEKQGDCLIFTIQKKSATPLENVK